MSSCLHTSSTPRSAVKLHNFQDKARIMQVARKAQSLTYNGALIMIFDNFFAVVIRKRQEYYTVKKQLKEIGIVLAMMYPAGKDWD